MSTIGILGCGWLGVPLGKYLQQLDYTVKGSRTSESGVVELQKKGIEGYCVVLEDDQALGLDTFLDQVDTLLISLPPKRPTSEVGYVRKIQLLLDASASYPIQRILFLSSTSVYGSRGNSYDETSPVVPETFSAKALVSSEQLLDEYPIPSVIVRLGGLIGVDRNPIYYLQGRTIPNPKGKINFIHQEDAVRGVATLVSHSELQGIFNLVAPHHPLREDYYLHMAQKVNLPVPEFNNEEARVRIIKGDKICRKTPFHYSVDNLLI